LLPAIAHHWRDLTNCCPPLPYHCCPTFASRLLTIATVGYFNLQIYSQNAIKEIIIPSYCDYNLISEIYEQEKAIFNQELKEIMSKLIRIKNHENARE